MVEATPQVRAYASAIKSDLLDRLFGPGDEGATTTAARLPAGNNVVGVGYGAKLVYGASVDDPAVRVYVRAKLPRSRLTAAELVPPEIDGVATDVIAVGDLAALVRPVRGGVSAGHIDITAGTLGCLVATSDGTRCILSNNHVLADSNAATIGDPILEPGPIDGGDPDDPIAELAAFVAVDFDGPNTVDAAIARLLDPGDVLPEIETIGGVADPVMDAALYQGVRKHGRTTQHTVGVVVDVAADIRVRFGTRIAAFDDQIAVVGAGGAFSDGGDSGSLIVDGPSRRPVGLLFAGGGGTTFANPIEPVLSAFDITIVT
jgi:hypothetical protein